MKPETRARVRERQIADQLDRWRLKGHIAASIGQPREAPPVVPRSTPLELATAKQAAWLAGYDARRPGRAKPHHDEQRPTA